MVMIMSMTLKMMLICQKTFVTPMSQTQQIIDHHRAAVKLMTVCKLVQKNKGAHSGK